MLFDMGLGGCDCREGGSGLGYDSEGLGVDLAEDFGFRGIVRTVKTLN